MDPSLAHAARAWWGSLRWVLWPPDVLSDLFGRLDLFERIGLIVFVEIIDLFDILEDVEVVCLARLVWRQQIFRSDRGLIDGLVQRAIIRTPERGLIVRLLQRRPCQRLPLVIDGPMGDRGLDGFARVPAGFDLLDLLEREPRGGAQRAPPVQGPRSSSAAR